MNSSIKYLVAGWTERIRYKVGATVGLTTLHSVALHVVDSSGAISTAVQGTAGIEGDPVNGIIYFDPASPGLPFGTFYIRWKITDDSGKVFFLPAESKGYVSREKWVIGR